MIKALLSKNMLVLVIIFISIIVSCNLFNSDGFNSGSVVFTGAIANNSRSILESGIANKIAAIPINDELHIETIREMILSDIHDDGTFSIEIDKSNKNTVLLLIDSTASIKEQILGYVALSDIDETLISFPIQDTESNVELGELTYDEDEVVSQNNLDTFTADFHMTIEELQSRAKADNILKNITNLYINDNGNEFWECNVVYSWDENLSSAHNIWTNPTNYSFSSYSTRFTAQNYTSIFTFNDLLNRSKIMTINPPGSIMLNDGTSRLASFSNDNEMGPVEERKSGDSVSLFAGDEDFYIAEQSLGTVDISPGGSFALPIPSGMWEVKLNGNNIASFDIGVGSPFNGEQEPIVPIPAITFETNSSGLVTKIEAKFYQYENGMFSLITDESIIEDYVQFAQFVIYGQSGDSSLSDIINRVEDIGFSISTDQMGQDWYYGASPVSGGIELKDFSFSYRAYGISCMFAFK